MQQPPANRPTKELELPFTGGKVVVKEWITGREQQHIEQPTTESIKMKPDQTGRMTFGDLDPGKIEESTQRAISTIVVSLNGETEDLGNKILDLPVTDYNIIVAYIQETIKKK